MPPSSQSTQLQSSCGGPSHYVGADQVRSGGVWRVFYPVLKIWLQATPIDSGGGRQRHQSTRLSGWEYNSIPIARSRNSDDSKYRRKKFYSANIRQSGSALTGLARDSEGQDKS